MFCSIVVAAGAYKTLVDSPPHLSMAFATSKNMNSPKLQIKMSTWTPLSNQLMNEQVSSVQMGQIHGITELLSLERTSGDHLVQLFKAKRICSWSWPVGFWIYIYEWQDLKQILSFISPILKFQKKVTYPFGCVSHE